MSKESEQRIISFYEAFLPMNHLPEPGDGSDYISSCDAPVQLECRGGCECESAPFVVVDSNFVDQAEADAAFRASIEELCRRDGMEDGEAAVLHVADRMSEFHLILQENEDLNDENEQLSVQADADTIADRVAEKLSPAITECGNIVKDWTRERQQTLISWINTIRNESVGRAELALALLATSALTIAGVASWIAFFK